MLRFRLGDDDRQRFGCPEWLEWDPTRMTNREAIALQKAGWDPPIKALRDAWRAQFEDLGDDRYRLARVDYEAWTAAVWLALRRAGTKVDLDELEFDVDAVQLRFEDADGEASEGKEPSTPPETSSG